MNAFDAIAIIAEQKILEAQEKGEFDNLPGAGKPLMLEDLSHLPPESRLAYSILKNSGYLASQKNALPRLPEAELKKDSPEEGAACGRLRRFSILMRKVRSSQGQADDGLPPLTDTPYLEQLIKRV